MHVATVPELAPREERRVPDLEERLGDRFEAPIPLPPILLWLSGLSALGRIHAAAQASPSRAPFADRALRALGASVDLSEGDAARIPATGPLVVVANHPLGGLDGLALVSAVSRRRPDVGLMANYLLGAVPGLAGGLFPVDPFGGPRAARRSVPALRAALGWLQRGKALVVFPAGEVASLRPLSGRVVEAAWSATAVRLALRSGAPVVPVWASGSGSAMFHAAGLLHPRLRSLLLPRELLRARGRTITLRVGSPVPPELLGGFGDFEKATGLLRARVERLSRAGAEAAARTEPRHVAESVPSRLLAREVASLPPGRKIVASGPWDVLHLLGGESKPLLAEIGRLREVTFRRVGEGTGKDRDLDRFDLAYEHVVLWNRDLREIGGAYRLAATDRLPRRNGLPDLYTGTLFDFTPAFFREVGPALELGRSFVRPEFQRQAAPLALLWRGIGGLVSANPRNACLLGAASISARYTEETRRLVVASLRANWSRPELSGLLLPGNPPEDGPDRLAAVLPRTVEGLEERVRRLEPGGAGLPVLLRHYLRLGAAFLSANVDPDFSGAWDVLLLVDLRRSPRVALRRHLGPEGAARFLGWHGVENQSIVPPVA